MNGDEFNRQCQEENMLAELSESVAFLRRGLPVGGLVVWTTSDGREHVGRLECWRRDGAVVVMQDGSRVVVEPE